MIMKKKGLNVMEEEGRRKIIKREGGKCNGKGGKKDDYEEGRG